MTSAPALRAKTFPSVRKTLASLAFLALGWAASAEERAVRFVNIGVREGLANASVSSIVQDEAGFIWVGPQGGLHRWDGMSFRLYENEPFDDASLPHNLIQTMYMDPDGFTLWLGTYGGLVRFDTKTGRFSSWVHEPGNPRSLSNDVVVAIARDASGSLWAGTLNGLNRMDGEGFVRYLPEAYAPATGSGTPGYARIRGLGSPVIRALHLDSRGRFWIGTSGAGLYRHEPSSDRFERYGAEPDSPLALPSAYVMDIDEDADGNLWLGLWFYGIARLDAGLSRVDGYKLADERVYFVNASVPGLIRAGTWGGGLFELSLPSGSVRRFTKSADRSWSLPHDTIYSMLVDASGETWVGTNGGGLSHMLKDAESFSLLEHDPSDPGSIASGKVNAILQDSRGRLWVGSYNGGLSRLDPGRAGFQRFLHDKKRPGSLPNDIVTKVYEASDSTIWILTNAGMARYDESSSTFISAFPGLNDPEGIASAVLYDMLEEPGTGNFWIATYTKGLAYWDRAENAISVRSAEPGKEGALGDNLVYALAYDSHGNLWLATNGGLYRLKPDGDFAAYRPVADDRTSLPSRIVRNLYVCPDGTVWLATNGGGVARYEEASDSFRYWTKRDGLPSNLAQIGRASCRERV